MEFHKHDEAPSKDAAQESAQEIVVDADSNADPVEGSRKRPSRSHKRDVAAAAMIAAAVAGPGAQEAMSAASESDEDGYDNIDEQALAAAKALVERAEKGNLTGSSRELWEQAKAAVRVLPYETLKVIREGKLGPQSPIGLPAFLQTTWERADQNLVDVAVEGSDVEGLLRFLAENDWGQVELRRLCDQNFGDGGIKVRISCLRAVLNEPDTGGFKYTAAERVSFARQLARLEMLKKALDQALEECHVGPEALNSSAVHGGLVERVIHRAAEIFRELTDADPYPGFEIQETPPVE